MLRERQYLRQADEPFLKMKKQGFVKFQSIKQIEARAALISSKEKSLDKRGQLKKTQEQSGKGENQKTSFVDFSATISALSDTNNSNKAGNTGSAKSQVVAVDANFTQAKIPNNKPATFNAGKSKLRDNYAANLKKHSNSTNAIKPNINEPLNPADKVLSARIFQIALLGGCQPQDVISWLNHNFVRNEDEKYTHTSLLHKNELEYVLENPKFKKIENSIENFKVKAGEATQKPTSTLSESVPVLVFEASSPEGFVDTYHFDGQSANTYFTDEQAHNICSKMADGHARSLALNYGRYLGKPEEVFHKNHLHYLANKALSFYGWPVLNFLIGLRPLNFNNTTANNVSAPNINKITAATQPDFPALTFAIKGEEYTLVFLLQSGLKIRNTEPQVRVYGKSKNQIGVINNQGYFISQLQRTSVSLLLFCEFARDSKKHKLFCGIELGKCLVCGNQLSSPVSLRYGIGPICLEKMGYQNVLLI